MRKLIYLNSGLKIGEFINKWFESKTIRKNQNVIAVVTGATGSAKTYNSLSMAERWYDKKFDEDFPIENVCFSLVLLMKRIKKLYDKGKLRKGETFILEEAGTNFGNLDFQQKLSKMFSYILQSFRSMNIILILTVPVLNMINKTARQLLHAHFITAGIDYENKRAKMKLYMHQLAQATGKSYWKFPRIKVNGSVQAIRKLNFTIPSERIIEQYEIKKSNFNIDLTEEFIAEAEKVEKDKILKDARKNLTDKQQEVYELLLEGKTIKEISEIKGVNSRTVYEIRERIKNKGFAVKIPKNP